MSLYPNNNHEGQTGEKKADPDLAQWSKGKDAVDRRVNDVVHQRDKNQDQDRVRCLHLGGEQVHAEPMQIHFLSLQGPFDTVAHSPECPEDQNENIDHRDSGERDEALAAECFSQIAKPRWRHMHHFFATAPEKQSRDQHRYARNSKCPSRSILGIRKEPWTEDRGDEGTSVNREIEPAKHL